MGVSYFREPVRVSFDSDSITSPLPVYNPNFDGIDYYDVGYGLYKVSTKTFLTWDLGKFGYEVKGTAGSCYAWAITTMNRVVYVRDMTFCISLVGKNTYTNYGYCIELWDQWNPNPDTGRPSGRRIYGYYINRATYGPSSTAGAINHFFTVPIRSFLTTAVALVVTYVAPDGTRTYNDGGGIMNSREFGSATVSCQVTLPFVS